MIVFASIVANTSAIAGEQSAIATTSVTIDDPVTVEKSVQSAETTTTTVNVSSAGGDEPAIISVPAASLTNVVRQMPDGTTAEPAEQTQTTGIESPFEKTLFMNDNEISQLNNSHEPASLDQLTSEDEWIRTVNHNAPPEFKNSYDPFNDYSDCENCDGSSGGSCPHCSKQRTWQLMPNGHMFKSYLAGPKESRLGSAWLYNNDLDWTWDLTAGARVGLIRHGTKGAFRPEGWQLDIEGAAFPLLRTDVESDLDSADFRFGLPLTWARGPFQMKFGYYHISAHVGDEFLARNPGFVRTNYVRDSIMYGLRVFVTDDFRVYGDIAYAFNSDGGAEPWEIQFGTEYSPARTNEWKPSPFWAFNAHLMEEHGFGGNLNFMAGWQWRAPVSNHLFRIGAQYFNGKSSQFAFFDEHREMYGIGVWYDF